MIWLIKMLQVKSLRLLFALGFFFPLLSVYLITYHGAVRVFDFNQRFFIRPGELYKSGRAGDL